MAERSQNVDATRQRIVEATVFLHGTVGPHNTTISAIAERAGVQRLTVYRHFPDEKGLFVACTSHWLSQNPPPDPRSWVNLEPVERRACAALIALYQYYRATAHMWELSLRDESTVPALAEPLAGFRSYLEETRDHMVSGVGKRRAPWRAYATANHTVQFPTWQSLVRGGLTDRQAANLATKWLIAVYR